MTALTGNISIGITESKFDEKLELLLDYLPMGIIRLSCRNFNMNFKPVNKLLKNFKLSWLSLFMRSASLIRSRS
jgi:hypothetical protein